MNKDHASSKNHFTRENKTTTRQASNQAKKQ